jgi:hypothetical protein
MNPMQQHCVLVAGILALAGLSPLARADVPQTKPGVTFDAANLRQGKFTYQLTSDGKKIGKSVIEIRAQRDGTWLLRMNAPEVQQRWSTVVRRAFEPVSAMLEMSGSSPYRMDLAYSNQQVTGTELRSGETHAINANSPRQMVDQRVDWASMMAATFRAGDPVEFLVYDAGTGFSRLFGTQSRYKPMNSVLGKVPTIRLDYFIHKATETEAYSVFATASKPRVMLREEMPNGLVSTLVAIED